MKTFVVCRQIIIRDKFVALNIILKKEGQTIWEKSKGKEVIKIRLDISEIENSKTIEVKQTKILCFENMNKRFNILA